jgi:hypothetical protein
MNKPTQPEYDPFSGLPKRRTLTQAAGRSAASKHPDSQRSGASKHLDGQRSEKAGIPAKPLAKSQDPAYTKFTTYVPIQLHRAVKSKLAAQGRELSGLVEGLLRDWNARGSRAEREP